MEGGGVALSSLRPLYHALLYSGCFQWLRFIMSSGGAHRFWPCSVNIIEHSECPGGSPGALYLNNIILYIDIYITYIITAKSCVPLRIILWISNDCVGFSDVSFLPHQSEVQTRPWLPCRHPAAGLRRETTIPFSSMSWFNLNFRESKPKCFSPNSFSTMAEISPTMSLVVEVGYQRCQRTRRSVV